MIRIEGWAHIQDGILYLENRKKFEAEIGQCQDCQVIITVKKRGKRSNPQNSYYHAVIVENIRHRLIELGHRITHEECHEEIKRKFLPEPLVDADGTIIFEKAGSTTDLNKSEFSEFVERIREWASINLDIDIPDADKTLSINF